MYRSLYAFISLLLLSLTTMCSSQSNEEKLQASTREAVTALQAGNTKAFIALIGFSDLDKISKTEEMVDFDVKKIQRLLSVHYANKPLQPEFPDLYNDLGKRVVRIPIYDQTQDNPRVKEMHLNLYFGPPNFVPLNRLSGYAIITNNSDSAEFRPLSYWKDRKVAY